MENNDNPLNEEELIRKGKEMVADGLGAAFVYKWLRERVEDEDVRGRILQTINTGSGPAAAAKSQDSIIEERKLRTVKYLYEDFQSATARIKFTGILYIVIGLLLLVSVFLLDALSLKHALLSIIMGAVLVFAYSKINWEEAANLQFWMGGLAIFILLEFLLFGLPDRLIPGFGEMEGVKIVHMTTIINDFTPILYFCLKVVLLYPFVKALYYKNKLGNTSDDLKRKLGIKIR